MTGRKTSALVWLVVGLVISVVLIGIAAASSFSRGDGDYGMMGGWGVGMAFMAVPAIILILILIIAIGELGRGLVTIPIQSMSRRSLTPSTSLTSATREARSTVMSISG